MDNSLQIMNDYKQVASELVKSNLIPKNFKSAPDAWYAILYGREMGLSPIYSLNNVTVINGKPSLSADAMLAVVKSSPEYGGVEVESTDTACRVTLKRVYKNGVVDVTVAEFTIQDAKQAGLFDSPGGMYKKYPKRMLRARAMAYACRDGFGDLLAGNYTEEELRGGVESPAPQDSKIIDVPAEPEKPKSSPAPVNQMEIINAAKKCDDLLNSFNMLGSEMAEYRNLIKAALGEKDLTKLEHIATTLQEKKDKAIAAHSKNEPIDTPFTPVDTPEAQAETAQEQPEAPKAEAATEVPVSQLKQDAINAMSSLLASSPNYEIKHGCASVKKQLGITFDGTDWQAAIINTPLPDGILLKAIAYWKEAQSKVKPSRTEAKPDYRTMCLAEFAKFPECRLRSEMQKEIDAAEGQTSDSEGWKILYEQAVEYLPEAVKEAQNENNE